MAAPAGFMPIGPGDEFDSAFCVYMSGTTHELIDVFGWLMPEPARSTLVVGIDV